MKKILIFKATVISHQIKMIDKNDWLYCFLYWIFMSTLLTFFLSKSINFLILNNWAKRKLNIGASNEFCLIFSIFLRLICQENTNLVIDLVHKYNIFFIILSTLTPQNKNKWNEFLNYDLNLPIAKKRKRRRQWVFLLRDRHLLKAIYERILCLD